ncbi:MAG: flagellar biosynthesis protein FlhB [Clostridia bacterium]|nr:flagellar biosynthesis protein FlhB [Clostridia bacterium]
MGDSGKTEKATQKKRDDERKKGNIFQSRDVTNALSFVLVLFAFKLLISPFKDFLQSRIINSINRIPGTDSLTIRSAAVIMKEFVIDLMIIIVPIGLGCALVAVTFTGIQTKFLFTASKLKPQFSRMNPVKGFKRILSLRSLMELIKSIVKVTIIAFVIYGKIKNATDEILRLPYVNLQSAITWIGSTIYDIAISISIYMALFAAADYAYQWWEYEKDIKMTKQEIKDEYKQTEGDPQVKGRIKEIQRKLASMRMMKKVPEADVIIKNPTHYAIALKYKPPKDKAPIVVAKGKNLVALKIIEIAEKNNIYITENRPLARGLYDAVQLDKPIPAEFYKPVADILAYLYKLKKIKSKK